MREENHNRRAPGLLAGTVICIIIMTLVFLGKAQEYSGEYLRGTLDGKNSAYLEKTEDKALSGFLLLSGIKAGLSIIEGSTANLALADIQFGDIVQSVLDAVDITWKILFATLGILMSMRFLLVLADQSAWFFLSYGAGMIALSFVSGLIILKTSTLPRIFTTFERVSRKAGLFLLMIFTFLYFLIPVSIFGASLLSRSITDTTSVEAMVYIEKYSTEISGILDTNSENSEKTGEGKDEDSLLKKMIDSPARVINYPRELLSGIKNTIVGQTKALTLKMVSLLVCFLFDVLLFPLIIFVLSYMFLKSLVSSLFGRWNRTDTLEDLQRLSSFLKDRE
ncbi:MAG TPA: hypothetical protein PLP89_07260 [Synergistales bacterium]|nr:hypothetical protein [Synergistales bacterium]